MIRNVWSVLCKTILTDQETNAVSYIQSIEEGAAANLPIVIPQVLIGTLWEKDSEQDEGVLVRVVIELPSGDERMLLQTQTLTFNRPRQRVHFNLESLTITEFGRHEVRIEVRSKSGWDIVSRLPFMIRKLTGSVDKSGRNECL